LSFTLLPAPEHSAVAAVAPRLEPERVEAGAQPAQLQPAMTPLPTRPCWQKSKPGTGRLS